VGERSYLAIGDVLALLREEFPDVTISKIRFLESRGLLVPERTPSGYRKFYEPDVDRLRWILRQQREHFLPLKVIKGRLDNGMSEPDAPAPLFEMGDLPPERQPEPVLVGAPGAGEVTQEGVPTALAALTPVAVVTSPGNGTPGRVEATGTAMGETRAHAGHAGGAGPTGPTEPAEPAGSTGSTGPTHETGPGGRRPRAAHAAREPDVAKSGAREPSSGPHRSGAPTASKARSQPAPTEGGDTGEATREVSQDPARPAAPASTRSTAGLPGAGLSGASLTVAELASASGLDVHGVEELESFGLIASRTVAGVHCYDEEAVLVAKLAARFAPYGLEARHLRIFKHAADRQTGLFAQVVTPLLRQRNPEARARALEDLSELSELGEALMRCFTQATLRELTGG